MHRRFVTAFGAVAALTVTVVQGDLIPGYEVESEPSLTALFTTVDYDAGADRLSVLGLIFEFDAEGEDDQPVERGRMLIDATIDDEGAQSGGTLTVSGGLPGLDAAGPVLLTGHLREFGYGTVAPGLGPFQLIFTLSGGELAASFGGVGADVGVSLSQGLGFDGSWEASFAGSGTTIGVLGALVDEPGGQQTPCSCRGDANCDTAVDMDDVIVVFMEWGECGGACDGDITGNQVVDVQDVIEVILHWGDCGAG